MHFEEQEELEVLHLTLCLRQYGPDWNQIDTLVGSSGGLGVVCSLMETPVPGSIPGIDFFKSSNRFSTSLTLDVGLFLW